MKTTIELPDELLRALKVRAAREGRRLKDVMAEVVRRGLAESAAPEGSARARVSLPLVRGAHPASAEQEMTPERTAEVLLKAEVAAALEQSGSLR